MDKELFVAVGSYGYQRKVEGPCTKQAINMILSGKFEEHRLYRWEVFSLSPVSINEIPVVTTTFKKEI